MKLKYFILFFIITINISYGQNGFHFESTQRKIVIPFQLINNLIFIPINVNGEALTFLLDTGVDETVLFSLNDKNEVSLFNVEKLKLKGLGSSDAIDAYKSSKNVLEINGYKDFSHNIYIVLDQEFNFSSLIGIAVNGIIGYNFFKNNLIEINYESKKIIIYNPENKNIYKKINKKFTQHEISLEENKPYYISNIKQNNIVATSKVLLDTGNSDALWLFKDKTTNISIPDKTITDFLGIGFSGSVFGVRGRITNFTFVNNKFENPLVTFPDSTSIKSVNFVNNRVGSVGGEVLSRFSIIFDYKNSKIYTRPNNRIADQFIYNKSGIEIQHDGLEWIKETFEEIENGGVNVYNSTSGEFKPQRNLKIKFELKPVFKIFNVRNGSAAQEAGLKENDKILRINHQNASSLSLEKINEILKMEDGKTIDIEIERKEVKMKFKFKLKTLI